MINLPFSENMNNKLDKKMHEAIEKAFRKADKDGDGRLSIDEIIFLCKVWSRFYSTDNKSMLGRACLYRYQKSVNFEGCWLLVGGVK